MSAWISAPALLLVVFSFFASQFLLQVDSFQVSASELHNSGRALLEFPVDRNGNSRGEAYRRGKLLAQDDDQSSKSNKEIAKSHHSKNHSVIVSLGTGILDAFISSFSMILVSEIGDETFIIAALMAMRHPRSIVLAGALSALGVMTVLSTGLGLIVPNLISVKATNAAATILYTFFGLRLLYIAWKADPNDTPQKELEEVEEMLEMTPQQDRDADKEKHEKDDDSTEKQNLVEGGKQVEERLEGDVPAKNWLRVFRRMLSRFCTPIFLEAFVLTFLAEWGDRSQIATIALAAHKNPVGVTIGAMSGHVICTTLAVIGGRLLALKISQRTVAMVGGLLFLAFAINSTFHSPV